ncbi:hypothetical protein F8568_022540 [Actinomadura sp. LD22]|uniref:Uncharacterized protein n=1 Tax=Actinomadura physcomitrii TaxID=2650748 RepID=A0A6I4MBN6_9ACTN|nr:hypothetical protein [Actinomadura physcomitrii]MWA02325.1 hypothetical protein [Actinomadura physcomitrii]MWA03103.1 hypothetical protein [Actinomadura physcomitrii]
MKSSTTEDLLKHQFQYLTRQIKAADSIPALLTAAFLGVDLIERTTTLLPDIGNDQARLDSETATIAAIDAWWVLSQAPTLAWPSAAPMTTGETQELVEAIAGFVLVVTEAILNVASKSADPGDRVACLQAAHHAGRLHAALK